MFSSIPIHNQLIIYTVLFVFLTMSRLHAGDVSGFSGLNSCVFVGRYRSSINDTSCTPRVDPQVWDDSDTVPDYDVIMLLSLW